MAPHEWDFGTDVVPLSDAQYQKLMEDINRSIANPPDYILPGTWWPNDGTNCTGWATDVWNDNGLPNEFGETNRWVWNPYGQLLWHELKKWLNDSYLAARTPPRRDPLAIDLDGDGIETVGVDAGVLFDHNADGIKTGTGWLKGDDAFLVLDRDGNGLIDSGRELFGVDTLVPADPYGGVGYAADGFVALASIDSNGDKIFDANDAQFANVRLWRDLNQDGISQADELQGLAAAGITAINLSTHQATKALPGGNTQTLAADVAGIDGSAVSLNLASNPFYRQFPDHLDTTAVADLPDMQGSGSLRDLREASTQSATLQGDLRALATQGYVNRETYLAQIKQLVDDWADTSPLRTSAEREVLSWFRLTLDERANLRSVGTATTSPGWHYFPSSSATINPEGGYVGFFYRPEDVNISVIDEALGLPTNSASSGTTGTTSTVTLDGATTTGLSDAQKAEQLAKWRRITHLIEVLERFNGLTFINLEPARVTDASGRLLFDSTSDQSNTTTSGGGGGGSIPVVSIPLTTAQVNLLEQSYAELVKSVSEGLILQTRLKGYVDSIGLVINQNGIGLDFSAMDAMIADRHAINAKDGFGDLVDLLRVNGQMFIGMGWTSGLSTLRTWTEAVAADPAWASTLVDLDVKVVNGLYRASGRADIVLGGAGNDECPDAAWLSRVQPFRQIRRRVPAIERPDRRRRGLHAAKTPLPCGIPVDFLSRSAYAFRQIDAH